MCGIIACTANADVTTDLLDGLERLEYRGYDSAGIAVLNGEVDVLKREGQVEELVARAEGNVAGAAGIGHTRWSTHGPPTDENAHPHTDCTGRVAVVHNGIIENHQELRDELADRGHRFTSDTDTEVVPHLIEEQLGDVSVETAFRRVVRSLEGSYAIALLVEGSETVYAARRGSPLVLGLDDDAHYLASDVPAFLEHTREVVHLEDGDVVAVSDHDYRITDLDGDPVDRPVETVDWQSGDAEKGRYDHFMRKEIDEQPVALRQSLRGRTEPDGGVDLEEFPPGAFAGVGRVQFVACGTSYHAARYGAWLLSNRGVPARAYRASEYATAARPTDDSTLVVGVTQSGETADTLNALRRADREGARTLAVTNVVGSTATRECDDALFIRAGPEIGVAATKTFSSQVATLVLLAERVARDCGGDPDPSVLADLVDLPEHVQRVLDSSDAGRIADTYHDSDAYFFVGRGTGHPVALEGALKFKEITYEHAEGFAAGELKHGPLALVTHRTPVFAVFTGAHDDKLLHNVEELQARGAPAVAVGPDPTGEIERVANDLLEVPDTHPEVAGLLANVHLQLVAYRAADQLDRPIDKPRNLAKSVTVE